MENKELRDILIAELGIGELPEEAQDEVVSKLGEIILKSVTVAIYEKLSPEARVEFDVITTSGDNDKVQEFLAKNIPDMPALMEAETKRVLQSFREGDVEVADEVVR